MWWRSLANLGTMPDLTGSDVGVILGAIRATTNTEALDAIRRLLLRHHPDDDATPTLLRLLAVRRADHRAYLGVGRPGAPSR